MKISKPYYRIDKCPKGHKMTGIGMSACDKIYECKCNKWIKYCNGPLIIFKKNGKKKIKLRVRDIGVKAVIDVVGEQEEASE